MRTLCFFLSGFSSTLRAAGLALSGSFRSWTLGLLIMIAACCRSGIANIASLSIISAHCCVLFGGWALWFRFVRCTCGLCCLWSGCGNGGAALSCGVGCAILFHSRPFAACCAGGVCAFFLASWLRASSLLCLSLRLGFFHLLHHQHSRRQGSTGLALVLRSQIAAELFVCMRISTASRRAAIALAVAFGWSAAPRACRWHGRLQQGEDRNLPN